MNFKAARCPTCGGALQIPEDLNTVKCMYCGGEIIVREAIQLAAGRVREFTEATAVEKIIDESSPFSIEEYKGQGYGMTAIICGIGLLIAIFAGGELGVFIGAVFLILAAIMGGIHFSKVKQLEEANEVMSKIPSRKQVLEGVNSFV